MDATGKWLSFALLSMVTPVSVAAPMLSEADKTAISEFSAAAIQRGDVPGAVTLIVNRDGVLYQGVVGKQDVARNVEMSANTIFRIASMTKPVTSVAIMMLVDAGKLKLDDPVSRYLPEFKDRPVISKFNAADATYETRPAKRAITIRHLMTHTAGLGYAFTDPTIARLLKDSEKTEPELPLLQDPGTQWQYSASPRVLGWVVEKVSGEKLDVFLQKQIFGPLKMVDTAHVVPADKVSRVVTVHSRKDGKLSGEANTPAQESTIRGDGGLYSTANDYAQFVRMLLNGGILNGVKILSRKSV